MTSKAMNLRKLKRELWLNYVNSQDAVDHARFTRCRNKLRSLTRRLRRDFEQDMVRKIKHDPKQFWKYSNSRLKTKLKIDDLQDENGRITSKDEDKAEIFNRFFCSVFTRENLAAMPMPPSVFEGPQLDAINLTSEMVKNKLDTFRRRRRRMQPELHINCL